MGHARQSTSDARRRPHGPPNPRPRNSISSTPPGAAYTNIPPTATGIILTSKRSCRCRPKPANLFPRLRAIPRSDVSAKPPSPSTISSSTFLHSPDGVFYTSQDADLVDGIHSADYFNSPTPSDRKQGIPRIDKHQYARENGWAIDALADLYAATRRSNRPDEAIAAANWITITAPCQTAASCMTNKTPPARISATPSPWARHSSLSIQRQPTAPSDPRRASRRFYHRAFPANRNSRHHNRRST